MADILSFILKADNKASPEFAKVNLDIKKLETTVRAYGTGTQEARTATSKMLDTLIASRGASDSAAGGLAGANRAAKDLAKGGLRDLLSDVPIVGGALAKLAGTLGGFPLLLGGIVGAGLGVLKFLQGLNEDSTKAAAGMTALANTIGADFQKTVRDVEKMRAESAGNQAKAVELGFQAEVAAAERAKTEKIAKAREELEQMGLFGQKRTELSKEALGQIAQAEAEAANATILAHTKKTAQLAELEKTRLAFTKSALAELVTAQADAQQAVLKGQGKELEFLQADTAAKKALLAQALTDRLVEIDKLTATAAQKLDERRVAEETFQTKAVSLEQSAADARKKILESLTSASLDIFKGLGKQFEDVVKKLEVAQLVTQTKAAMDTQKQAFEAGAISQGDLAKGTQALTEKMQDAIRLGYVPTTQAAKDATAAVTEMGTAGETAGEKWLKSIEGISPALDAIAAKTRAAAAAVASVGSGGGAAGGGGKAGATSTGSSSSGGKTGVQGLDFTTLGGVAGQSSGSGLTPIGPLLKDGGGGSNRGNDLTKPTMLTFAQGGIVPGRGPVPIIAHGGEEVVPASQRGRRGDRPSITNHVSVNISGTVVQQDRDWLTLVETLGQDLDARMARMYR